ncbi:MAG: 30S ribosomal protein S8 [Rickettsiales bacterium]|jgi:small subunit ribosomal protein S8|nr:30S ribosomal protein S8 [Rickettsiales bacterium]
MSNSDPLADMLTRIRNGQSAHLAYVQAPYSQLHEAVLLVLKEEGFISSFSREEIRSNVSVLNIKLKYFENSGVIKTITKISKPGKRIYYSTKDLKEKKFCNGLGVAVISTPKGVISDKNAIHHNVGGEVLCTVF